MTINPRQGFNGYQFGSLFTDRVNIPNFNQAQLTIERVIDPAQRDFDVGFNLLAIYGSDARFLHLLGQFDRLLGEREQLVVRSANVAFHLPVFTELGVDLKIGEFPSPIGYEPYDPALSPFYSHSYVFFTLPASNAGALATIHVNSTLDIWAGVDTGTQTGWGYPTYDNNRSVGGHIGIGLNNLLDGKLTLLAISHIGPDTPLGFDPRGDRYNRYINNFIATYKYSDTLSFTGEGLYFLDTQINAQAYGAVGYVSQVLSDELTLNLRGEVLRDDKGFFIAGFPKPLDPLNSLAGLPNSVFGVGPATYTEFTAGFTYRPKTDGPVKAAFRPEIRYDRAFGARAFNNGRDRDAITLAADIVLSF